MHLLTHTWPRPAAIDQKEQRQWQWQWQWRGRGGLGRKGALSYLRCDPLCVIACVVLCVHVETSSIYP